MPARIVIRDRGRGLSTADRTMINQAFDYALRTTNRIRRRIRKIKRWLDRGRIVVPSHGASDFDCRGNRNTFVRLSGRPLHIHLCPNWFSQKHRRAAILIHELVHELGFTYSEGVDTRAEALALARRNSRKAKSRKL